MSWHDLLFTDRYDLWDIGVVLVAGVTLGIAIAGYLILHVTGKQR